MITPVMRALEQLDDPRLRRVLWQSLLLSLLAFAALITLAVAGLHHALATHGWLGWLAGGLGGVLAALTAVFLYIPVAVMIAGQFIEPVCRAVEQRWYPGLPPPTGASLAAQGWEAVKIGFLVLALNLLSLLLTLLLPGVGAVLGWIISAWALGRGLFAAVAMRRMDRRAAALSYREHRLSVLIQGAALALIGSVPILNLLLPIVGTAAMVHVLHQVSRVER